MMVQYSWFFFAIGAALFWGVNYATAEKIFHGGVPIAVLMFFNALVIMLFAVIWGITNKEKFKIGLDIILGGGDGLVAKWILPVQLLSSLLGIICINMAIHSRNATVVSMIEITYPLFTILFTWILFKESHLNGSVALGACFILFGSFILLWKG